MGCYDTFPVLILLRFILVGWRFARVCLDFGGLVRLRFGYCFSLVVLGGFLR